MKNKRTGTPKTAQKYQGFFHGAGVGSIDPTIAANFDGAADVVKTLPNGQQKTLLVEKLGNLASSIYGYAKRCEWLTSVNSPIEA